MIRKEENSRVVVTRDDGTRIELTESECWSIFNLFRVEDAKNEIIWCVEEFGSIDDAGSALARAYSYVANNDAVLTDAAKLLLKYHDDISNADAAWADVRDAICAVYDPRADADKAFADISADWEEVGGAIRLSQPIIDGLHANTLWYGGELATIEYKGKPYSLCANGDVRAYSEQASVKDTGNRGDFYGAFSSFIKDDEELSRLIAKKRLIVEDGNWLELFTDSGKSMVIPEEDILLGMGAKLIIPYIEALEDRYGDC